MTTLALDASATMPAFIVDQETPCPNGLIAFADGLSPRPPSRWARGLNPGTDDDDDPIRGSGHRPDLRGRRRCAIGGSSPMAARGYGLTPLVHRGYHGPASQRGGRRGERLPHTERSYVFLLGSTWHLMQVPTLVKTRTHNALGANRKARNRPWPDTDSTDRSPPPRRAPRRRRRDRAALHPPFRGAGTLEKPTSRTRTQPDPPAVHRAAHQGASWSAAPDDARACQRLAPMMVRSPRAWSGSAPQPPNRYCWATGLPGRCVPLPLRGAAYSRRTSGHG